MERVIVQTTVHTPIEKVWECYTKPEHITKWNFADESWHCPRAENDVRPGGSFSSRMEAKDGSVGFDFAGTYDSVVPNKKITYSFGDRKAEVTFTPDGAGTMVVVSFDPETENPIEMQRTGWQAILENFKKHVESE